MHCRGATASASPISCARIYATSAKRFCRRALLKRKAVTWCRGLRETAFATQKETRGPLQRAVKRHNRDTIIDCIQPCGRIVLTRGDRRGPNVTRKQLRKTKDKSGGNA